jgi:hypothetical protein
MAAAADLFPPRRSSRVHRGIPATLRCISSKTIASTLCAYLFSVQGSPRLLASREFAFCGAVARLGGLSPDGTTPQCRD